MVTKKFVLVCKSLTGNIHVSDLLYSSSELQDGINRLNAIDFRVIDVIPVEIDFSKYEY